MPSGVSPKGADRPGPDNESSLTDDANGLSPMDSDARGEARTDDGAGRDELPASPASPASGAGRDESLASPASAAPNVYRAPTLGLRCQMAGASVEMPSVTGPLSINAVFNAAARSNSFENEGEGDRWRNKSGGGGLHHASPTGQGCGRVAANSALDDAASHSIARPIRACVATCNRADYSKLAPVIGALQADPAFELSIIVSGSHLLDDYGLTFRMLIEDGFNPDARLHTIVRGEDEAAMVESVGLSMIKLPDVLTRLRPDILIIHGDRFDVLAYAGAAALMNIRIVHMEGGEVSGTIDDCLRHAISKLAQFHLVSNDLSKRRLLAMGEEEERILVAGCPSYDSLLSTNVTGCQEAIDNWIGKGCRGRDYIIAVQHPVTTSLSESITHFEMMLDALIRFEKPTLLLMPNVDAGSKELTRIARLRGINPGSHEFIVPVKHVPFHQFIQLLANAGLVVGNSSSGVREAGAFGTPVINLGTRQIGRESASNVLHVQNPASADQVADALSKHFRKEFPRSFIYGDGRAVPRIVRFLKRVNLGANIQKTFDFSACAKLLRPRHLSSSSLQELDRAFRGMAREGSPVSEGPLIRDDADDVVERIAFEPEVAAGDHEASRDGVAATSTMIGTTTTTTTTATTTTKPTTAAAGGESSGEDDADSQNNSRGDWDPVSYAVGVDLGGSRLRVALVPTKGGGGAVVGKIRVAPTPRDPRERVRVIVDNVIAVLKEAREEELRVLGVGISTGGRVDFARGKILDATSLLEGWTGVELVATLQTAMTEAGFTGVGKGLKGTPASSPPPASADAASTTTSAPRYQLPVFIDNDGNCAALGESRWGSVGGNNGSAQAGESMVVIATGTGIGGGIISDAGDVVRGSNFCGGELGHMVVSLLEEEEGGDVCSCGSFGCLEAVASGSALNAAAERLIADGHLELPPDDESIPKAKALIDAARTGGNARAAAALRRATDAMSMACLNLLHVLNPKRLVFTGHLADVMKDPVERFVRRRALKNAREVEIYASRLENPSLLGAATLVMESCQAAWMEKKVARNPSRTLLVESDGGFE